MILIYFLIACLFPKETDISIGMGTREGIFQHEMQVGFQEYDVRHTGTDEPWDFSITQTPVGAVEWTDDTEWVDDPSVESENLSIQICGLGSCGGF